MDCLLLAAEPFKKTEKQHNNTLKGLLLQGRISLPSMLLPYAITAPAVFLTAPLITTLTVFIMEHISISGSPPPPFGFLVGDVVLGAVCSLAFFVAASFYTTCYAHASKGLLKVLIVVLGSSLQLVKPMSPAHIP